MNDDKIKQSIIKHFPFDEFNPGQIDAIYKSVIAIMDKKEHIILSCPTGVGKSVIAITIHNVLNELYRKNHTSVVLSTTKGLQDQYNKDFPELVDLKGKTNYYCHWNIFEGYKTFVGQDELVFSQLQGIAEIYKIHGSVQNPESIVINKADYQKFSLNDYQLKLKVEASDDIRLSIRFTQFIDKYSKSEDYNTLPIFIKTIGLHKGENKIDVAAKNINEVPDWWIAKNPKAASLVNEVPLDNTVQMWIFCEKNSAVPLDKEFTLHISEFSLEGGTYWPYILAFLLIYGIIIFIYIKIKCRIFLYMGR